MGPQATALIQRLPAGPAGFLISWHSLSSKHRMRVLATDAAFWLLFSLPWMVLALVATLGVSDSVLGVHVVEPVRADLEALITSVVGGQETSAEIRSELDHLFVSGRALGIVGYLIAFTAGTRAFGSLLDSISILNGLGPKPFLKRSAQALGLYLATAGLASVAVILATVGTDGVAQLVDAPRLIFQIVDPLILTAAALLLILALYRLGGGPASQWRSRLPGALAALVLSAVCLGGVIVYLKAQLQLHTVIGLAVVPLALMLFSFLLCWSLLSGAMLNVIRTAPKPDAADK